MLTDRVTKSLTDWPFTFNRSNTIVENVCSWLRSFNSLVARPAWMCRSWYPAFYSCQPDNDPVSLDLRWYVWAFSFHTFAAVRVTSLDDGSSAATMTESPKIVDAFQNAPLAVWIEKSAACFSYSRFARLVAPVRVLHIILTSGAGRWLD